jgi:hypothetical protein
MGSKTPCYFFSNKGGIFDQKNELLDSSMGNQTSKTIGDRTYILQKYHHQLISERILNNKLSLVYMKLMQYMALTYASVPFIISTDEDVQVVSHIQKNTNGPNG